MSLLHCRHILPCNLFHQKIFISSHWLISYFNIIISLSSLYPVHCGGMVSCHLFYQYFGQHSSKATGSFPALQTSHYSMVPLKNFLNPFPNKPWFLRVCSTSLLRTLWKKEKLLVTSNFSFSHSVFYPS